MAVKKNIKKKSNIKKTKHNNDTTRELESLKEKIMDLTWHHMQTESTVKQMFCDLIDVLINARRASNV